MIHGWKFGDHYFTTLKNAEKARTLSLGKEERAYISKQAGKYFSNNELIKNVDVFPKEHKKIADMYNIGIDHDFSPKKVNKDDMIDMFESLKQKFLQPPPYLPYIGKK